MYPRISARPLVHPVRSWASAQNACRLATSSAPRFNQPGTESAEHDRPSIRGNPTNWIRLHDVPRTALHNDVRRAVTRSGVGQKFQVYLDYYRFLRTPGAWLKFENQQDMHAALQHIGGRKFQITAQDILAIPTPAPSDAVQRSRGFRGRAIAAQKGSIHGNGPDAGTRSMGRDVVLYGLPGKIEPEDVLAALKGFAFRKKANKKDLGNEAETDGMDEEERAQAVYKLPQIGRSLTSRHLVRLESQSEAHRLVRQLHMTYWDQDLWGTKYTCRARVVY
ncbi:hypothetical protein CALVIDRAFT_179483 [Calocera viscosa TUFC12733]|uniref:RRM domain-containing protein n=1 Tax=Calocera viscosa (strain TUFC12733) TaxID=1330018 RepID=A0A167KZ42_CALVF|nr:hypothetical protein CALVIDRAFT_179483 [Calocera viscosa TUFC12733]